MRSARAWGQSQQEQWAQSSQPRSQDIRIRLPRIKLTTSSMRSKSISQRQQSSSRSSNGEGEAAARAMGAGTGWAAGLERQEPCNTTVTLGRRVNVGGGWGEEEDKRTRFKT